MSFGFSNFCCCFLLIFWLVPVQAQEIDKNIPPSLDKLEANAVDLKIINELAVREEDTVSKTSKSITDRSFEILSNSVFSREELTKVTQPFFDIGTVWNNEMI